MILNRVDQSASDSEIDFVIIWVDGNDPEWIREKNRYTPDATSKSSINLYRDWSNLQYWFRGVEKFAPWVRKIHFVTWGHVPEWLNLSHPKLNLVRHEDYIPRRYLPTFSSHSIELNLHRIEELSEHFVFFNDDIFIIDHVEPSDFFVSGLPCDEAVMCPLISKSVNQFDHILLNDIGLINQSFSKKDSWVRDRKKWLSRQFDLKTRMRNLLFLKTFGDDYPFFRTKHLPAPLLKSVLNEAWEVAGPYLSATSERKFRDVRDMNQYIFRFWQLVTGRFSPKNFEDFGKNFSLPRDRDRLFEAVKKQKYRLVCANDTEESTDFENMAHELIACFKEILPNKSSFER